MGKDSMVWGEVSELLDEVESEAGENALREPEGEESALRLERVADVRRRYLAEFDQETFTVYVPAAGSPLGEIIAGGSAVVGVPDDESFADRVDTYFEGNIHGTDALERYSERAALAAGRMAGRYPTVARALAPRTELVPVGRITDDGSGFYEVEIFGESGREALADWLGLAVGKIDGEIRKGA